MPFDAYPPPAQAPPSGVVEVDPFPFPGAGEWTDPVESVDTVKIYVSTSGSDTLNDGLSELTPVATIAKGKSLMRNGKPDWLLLKRGDTWTEAVGYWTINGAIGGTPISGRGADERAVLSTYGTGARPIVKTGTSCGVRVGTTRLQYVYILGLDFWPHTFATPFNTDTFGFEANDPFDYVHIEDCNFRRCARAARVWPGSQATHFVFRRNQVVSCRWNNSNYGPGAVFLEYLNTALIEENTLGDQQAGPAIRSLSLATNVNVRLNVISHVIGVNSAIRLAGGGTVFRNAIIQCGNGIRVGNRYAASPLEEAVEGGVACSITWNLLIEGDSGPDAYGAAGQGIAVENISSGVVSSNILTQNLGSSGFSIQMFTQGNTSAGNPCGCHNLTFSTNVVYRNMLTDGFQDWALTLESAFTPSNTRISGIVITHNDFQEPVATTGFLGSTQAGTTTIPGINADNNRHWRGAGSNWFLVPSGAVTLTTWKTLLHDTTSSALQVAYPFPEATISDYMTRQGLTATTAAFLAGSIAMDRSTWDYRYTADKLVLFFTACFNA